MKRLVMINQDASFSCQLKLMMGFLVCIAYFPHEANSETGQRKDVCLFESFEPRCLKNEAILMQTATYGRMRIGRCITAEEVAAQRSLAGDDPRFLGCSEDVLPVLDAKCSGKVECEIRGNDISDDNIQPCFAGLKMYLEIDYSCITVVDAERSCVVTVSANPVHIVSSSGSKRICGTKTQPWILEAPVGQKIRINVFYIGSSSADQNRRQISDSCRNEGVIVDKIRKGNTSICVGGGQQRETELYLSTGNTLEIYLSATNLGKESKTNPTFILKAAAVGCSDIIPPEDTWLKRSDDTIQIGCYSSRQTWQLNCREGKWVGVLGNCSHDLSQHRQEYEAKIVPSLSSNGQVLAIIAICGFTLAICLMIMCIGAICVRRYYNKVKKTQDYKTLNYSTRSQQRMMNSDITANCFNGIAVHGVNTQHMPTNSVHEDEQDTYATSALQSA